MRKVIVLFMITSSLFAWEINTHRAIDQRAIKNANNFSIFIENSNIINAKYTDEIFEGYGMSYRKYLLDGEEDGISANKWNQVFPSTMHAKDLIEAGSILEDAQWPNSARWNGRFVNHFYDAQFSGSGSRGLVYLGTRFLSADLWALQGIDTVNRHNLYSYNNALDYFIKGFTESSPIERKKYQAKMLVSVGHLMHMVNDMSSTAHTRADPHAEGDVMEVWGSGGESGNKGTGFRVSGNRLLAYAGISKNPDNRVPKYGKFADFITQEATWTATHFFSKDTIFTKKYPRESDTYEDLFYSLDGLEKYYVRSDSISGIPRGTKLAIRVKSYITNALKEKYYKDNKLTMGFDMSTSFRGNYSVITDNAKILIPRAIANGRNFVNYFFRGQIEAKIDGSNITIKNISDKSLVKDGYTATLGADSNYFHIKYHTGDGILKDFEFVRDENRFISNIAHIGPIDMVFKGGFSSLVSLAPGESIVVAIKRDTSIMSKNIVVMYDGQIGNERGIAICSAQTPSVMQN